MDTFERVIKGALEKCYAQQAPECTRFEDFKYDDGMNCGDEGYDANITSQQELSQIYCNDRNTESTESSDVNGCEHPIECAREVQLQPPTCTNKCNQCTTSSSWWQSWIPEKDCTPTQLNAKQPTPQVGCLGLRQEPQTRKNLPQWAQEHQSGSICHGYPQASEIPLSRFSRAKMECRKQSPLKTRVLQHQGPKRSCKAQTTLEAIMQTLMCRKCPDIRCRRPLKLINNWHLGVCGGPKCRRSLKQANSNWGIEDLQMAILCLDNGDAMKKATEMNLSNWSTEDLQKAIRNIDNQNAIKKATNMCNIRLNSVRDQLKTLSNWSTEDLQKELQDIDNGNAIKEIAHKYRVLLGLIKDHYRGKKAI